MQALEAELLRGLWYVALPGAGLPAGTMRHQMLLGEPLLIGRRQGASRNSVFALRDICPHRGIPLHYGRFNGEDITCCYHGWRFDTTGACIEIPSLREGQQVDLAKIRCTSYPCVEQQGLVWIYFPRAQESAPGPPPRIPIFADDAAPIASIMLPFPCSTDHAAFGLMDPTHAAFVHTSWWFKKEATKLRPKEKHFEPTGLGWRMIRHRLPPQNLVYKLLGSNVETEISYSLPGLRVEEVHGERHAVVGLTAITPINDQMTEVHQMFWASPGWAAWLSPLMKPFMRTFLDQDRRVVVRQREGLLHQPRLMLINDADTQARWWMRLKSEWSAAQAQGRAFVNPLEPQTLRWRS